jgi:GNAT superfamily N-acetyltransferase
MCVTFRSALVPIMSIDEIREAMDEALVAAALRSKLLNWDLDWNAESGALVLDRIQVADGFLGQGVAKQVMKIFVEFCDGHGLGVELTVRPLDERTTESGLRRLYGTFDFVEGPDNKMFRTAKRNYRQ